MVISADPHILSIENNNTYMTKDIMDFWRPTYSDVAYVDGKFSNEQYLSFFDEVWNRYKEGSGKGINDFKAICFHLPYSKMGLKALRTILGEGTDETQERLQHNFQASTKYCRRVGNIYTASLYLGLISLLENTKLEPGDRVGFFSYGSGAVGEFFTGILEEGYERYLVQDEHSKLFAARERISVEKYESIFNMALPKDGSTIELDTQSDPAVIQLTGVKEHMRQYENKAANQAKILQN